jgi:hypothetical protein
MQEGIYEILQRLGTVLHAQNDHITYEPLPRRWLDLIRHLNKKDRLSSQAAAPSSDSPLFTGVCLVGDKTAGRITDVQVTAPDGHSIPLPLDQYLGRDLWPDYETLPWCEDLKEKLRPSK